MSLVRFSAANHPQQQQLRGARDEIDDRATPPELFEPLNDRFDFTIDVAAASHNTKCPRYFTIDDDGLAQPWASERVWCNPPLFRHRPVGRQGTRGARRTGRDDLAR